MLDVDDDLVDPSVAGGSLLVKIVKEDFLEEANPVHPSLKRRKLNELRAWERLEVVKAAS